MHVFTIIFYNKLVLSSFYTQNIVWPVKVQSGPGNNLAFSVCGRKETLKRNEIWPGPNGGTEMGGGEEGGYSGPLHRLYFV